MSLPEGRYKNVMRHPLVMEEGELLSIIITLNEEECAGRLLQDLALQTHTHFEVILVDSTGVQTQKKLLLVQGHYCISGRA